MFHFSAQLLVVVAVVVLEFLEQVVELVIGVSRYRVVENPEDVLHSLRHAGYVI